MKRGIRVQRDWNSLHRRSTHQSSFPYAKPHVIAKQKQASVLHFRMATHNLCLVMRTVYSPESRRFGCNNRGQSPPARLFVKRMRGHKLSMSSCFTIDCLITLLVNQRNEQYERMCDSAEKSTASMETRTAAVTK